ncbi:NAD(P)-dependent dehydrogenase (short-subunit alcohol dehydrogenase family) [Actinoalloteichus hoggarensis]|uniref:7-alpha-hydroxysteroid dehydrogenase n=1 Tax=Actinoalloteichus hoggarensis TaxID=1470176 RepID=A0A221W5N9_9PSEU|nr:SDR family oxidoreductase [Actinoalloteichus hoggarensis]ASO20919.1 7-alpha-hydroxysteroid dehydrogenase [Actinoalloteichus hoggarensis]MBB5920849.1 NAD(P)-dependent dehydrogenase (short-subunit alcohol dehydrogenase family) [Actinoalloteichus hoggarensis]
MGGLLEDKVVLVAGAGRCLGRAIAVQCALAGADVVLAARTGTVIDQIADEVEQTGRRALAVPADLTDPDAAAALASAATTAFGRVDALVNNAFARPPMADLADVELAAVRATLEVDVFAALRLTRMLAPALVESRGAVVMVNSAALRHSRPRFGAYKVAKAGLLALAQSLSTELGPQGVRVNSVAPGYVWAEALEDYFAHLAAERGVAARQVYDEVAANLDLRELPEPEAVGDAVVFLISSLARAVTGHCLDVNAGEFHH